MSWKERSVTVAWGVTSAVMVGLIWAGPAFAQIADGDGFDGDELDWPLLLVGLAGVLVGIALAAYRRGRRTQPPSEG